MRSSVHLPHPLGPITDTRSPSATERLTPLRAGMPTTSFFTGVKNVLWMLSTDSLAAVIASVAADRTCYGTRQCSGMGLQGEDQTIAVARSRPTALAHGLVDYSSSWVIVAASSEQVPQQSAALVGCHVLA